MGRDRPARWRRRWTSSLTWPGLGTALMGRWTHVWTGYSQCPHSSCRCRRAAERQGGRGIRDGQGPLYGARVVVYFFGSDSRRRAHRLGMRG
ncbi:hypothetical protein DFH09DRAFT_1204341 [Mycena vulgaris]|nr:hypothetical protein DFH09DRAFT_1204341 [Mycena vulgaris]